MLPTVRQMQCALSVNRTPRVAPLGMQSARASDMRVRALAVISRALAVISRAAGRLRALESRSARKVVIGAAASPNGP